MRLRYKFQKILELSCDEIFVIIEVGWTKKPKNVLQIFR